METSRTVLTATCVVFLVASIGVPLYFYLKENQTVQLPCNEHLSIPLSNPISFPNGSLKEDDVVYPPGYYYSANGTTRGCLCLVEPCFRKCCEEDEYLVKAPNSRSKCARNPGPSPFDNFTFPVLTVDGNPTTVGRDHFATLFGDVCVHGKFALDPDRPGDKHDLMVDGKLRSFKGNYLDVSKYCMDSINGSGEILVFICFEDPGIDDETKIQYRLNLIAMMISIPFLIATVLVYSVLPELRNLHGKSLVCQCSSLLVTYVCLVIIQYKGGQMDDFSCVFLAFMIQFVFLASFFWLNVMSFDIWWSISGLRPPRWGVKGTEHKKFLLYSLYAWGMPLTIVAVSVTVDMIPSIPDYIIKPHFGHLKCWFKDWQGALIYFYLPTGVVLGLNIVMFITTAIKLQTYTKNDRNKDRFHLYLRLSVVMGLNWTLELLSFFVGGPKYIWLVTDVGNMLQGVIIFFCFVCKRKILQKLNKKLCPCWHLWYGTSQDISKSLNSSVSQTKTEVDEFALRNIDSNN